MSLQLKNLAIVAHVDHGKTTLVDGLLKAAGAFAERAEIVERVMDSGELERERGITISAKNCSLNWKGFKVNLLDTPGHADFGGEVERSVMMVDGVLLLVDASEGPLPQTRFVLQKAMERGCKIAVLINKIDRPDQRIEEVRNEVEDLLLELATFLELEDFDVDIPFLYASARDGHASKDPKVYGTTLAPILDLMVSDYYPSPRVDEGEGLKILVTNLSYSPYLGQQAVGRIQRGRIKKHGQATIMGKDKNKNFKVTAIEVYDRLGRTQVEEAGPGEIVIVSGMENVMIGDTLSQPDKLEAMPRVEVEPPTVGVHVSVSTSPLSGKEGEYLTSRKLEEFLIESTRQNVALQYTTTDDPKVFILKGRGELQLAIVFEQVRRKGFEFMVGRPEVLMKEENGEKLEPFEKVVIDVPSNYTGAITEKLSNRKGVMSNMSTIGDNRVRMEFVIPTRGLIGYRTLFLTDTKGEGIMSSYLVGYRPFVGAMLGRQNGAIISDRLGKTTPYALFNLLSSGRQFIKPGAEVYEGMVIGEHTRTNDVNVNCVREKHLSSVRTAGKDENITLPPIPEMTLDFAMDWIDNDEWVEVTPQNVRIRKRNLAQSGRSVIRKGE
jgi:GTP-binding protein